MPARRSRAHGTPPGRPHTTAPARRERELLGRFMRAWESVDIEGLVALLAEDALMTMPPVPMAVHGAEAIGRFFATVPAGGRLDEILLVPTAANGQPALAACRLDAESGEHRGYGVMVFALDGERIHGIVGFADMALLGRFGLPTTLEDDAPIRP